MAGIEWSPNALEQFIETLLPIAADDPELADELAERIEKAVERLALFPESAPVYLEPYYRLVIPRLPYVCYYLYAGGDVYITAFRHERQEPCADPSELCPGKQLS